MIVNPGTMRGGGRARPSFRLDFVGPGASLDTRLTFTRASSGTYFDVNSVLQTATTDTARFDYLAGTALGLLIEEARTNTLLWNRDFTNIAWTALNVTPLKNITGIDGVANSASRLTAGANSGTILQTVAIASAARTLSFYVKRITGTGAVSITQDGLSWTAVTVTAAWTRVSLTATQLNPVVGFQFATSGDAIAVDYGQLEAGAFAASPIAVTTVAVARAADRCSIPTSAFPYNAAEGTIVATATAASGINAAGGINQIVAQLDDGTSGNRLVFFRIASTKKPTATLTVSSVAQATLTAVDTWNDGATGKFAFAWAAGDQAIAFGGATAIVATGVSIPTVTTLFIGDVSAGSRSWGGQIASLAYYPRRLSNTLLQALTS